MTSPPSRPHIELKWYGLALRDLRIVSRLLRAGFTEAAFFYSYHAFECAVSAIIASKNYPVPPAGARTIYTRSGAYHFFQTPAGQKTPSTHKARLMLFNELADRSKAYYGTFLPLSRTLTNRTRNAALYYDEKNDLLPHQQYNRAHAEGVYATVRKFVREVGEEIR